MNMKAHGPFAHPAERGLALLAAIGVTAVSALVFDLHLIDVPLTEAARLGIAGVMPAT